MGARQKIVLVEFNWKKREKYQKIQRQNLLLYLTTEGSTVQKQQQVFKLTLREKHTYTKKGKCNISIENIPFN